MSIKYITGNIVDADEYAIVQQCCCTAVRPHGLSETLAKAFKHGNAYGKRRSMGPRVNCAILEDRPTPGTIDILGDGITERKIVCLYGQYAMGKPQHYFRDHGIPDTATDRLTYFATGLEALSNAVTTGKLRADTSNDTLLTIAFPFKIGCGLAGGNWKLYETMIRTFATDHPDVVVSIYVLPS